MIPFKSESGEEKIFHKIILYCGKNRKNSSRKAFMKRALFIASFLSDEAILSPH